jgi:putative lipoprotein
VRIICILFAAMLCASVAGPQQSDSTLELKGTVTYLERMLLPKAASVRILVLDATDRPEGTLIKEQLIATEGRQIPIPFKVLLPAASIDPERRYSVKAEILIGGKVWFTTKKAVPVLTHGNPRDVEIVLVHS